MKIAATIQLRNYHHEKEIDLPALAQAMMDMHEDPGPSELLDAVIDSFWQDIEDNNIDFYDAEVDDVRVSRYALTTEALISAYAEARILASRPPFNPNQLTLGIS